MVLDIQNILFDLGKGYGHMCVIIYVVCVLNVIFCCTLFCCVMLYKINCKMVVRQQQKDPTKEKVFHLRRGNLHFGSNKKMLLVCIMGNEGSSVF